MSIENVDPIDYEEFLDEHREKIDLDPLKHLLEYPIDDVDFIRIERQYRTIIPVMPEKEALIDPHIRDCLQSFNGEHFYLRRNYQNFGSAATLVNIRQEQLSAMKQIPKQDFEIDLIDDNRQTLIEQERDSPRKSTNNDSTTTTTTLKSSWTTAKEDLDKTEPDTIMPHLIERIPIESVDKENELLRAKNRYAKLFSCYPPQIDNDWIEYRPAAEPLQPYTTFKLQVKCLEFKFEPEIEPMFFSMCLFDFKERKKISENFHFDLNSDVLKQMIQLRPAVDGSTLSLSAIFPVSFPSADIYLVIRVEKVLQQGDLSDCAEPYLKQDSKNFQRYHEQSIQYCQRLGRYRMPFGWTAISLKDILKDIEQETNFTSNSSTLPANVELINSSSNNKASSLERRNFGSTGFRNAYESFRRSRDESLTRNSSRKSDEKPSMNSSLPPISDEFFNILANFDRPIVIQLKGIYKQETDRLTDEDILKFLTDFRKPPTLAKKPKTIPVSIRFEFNQIHPGDAVDCCLDPQLNRLKPYTDDTRRPIKECLEFPPREIYLPHTSYRNLLYLYPLGLNFSNLTTRGSTSARNIAVKIQLMGGEEEIFALPRIFGRSSGQEMIKEIYLPVVYHSKTPSFYDEIKIHLPAVLDENHHLLFTFYHISCQPKENAPVETPIAYTWLPLLHNNQLIHGDFHLPVAYERPTQNYSLVSPTNHDINHVKWVDNHKPLFSLVIRPSSTIHSLDDRLAKFFHCYNELRKQSFSNLHHHHHHHHHHNQINEKDFKQSIMDTVWAQPEKLVQFLYILLDTLLSLLVRPPIVNGHLFNVNQTCFETLTKIVQRIQRDLLSEFNDHHGRNRLLLTYIHYECTLHSSTEPDLSAISSKSASLRPNSLYFQRRVPRSTSNPDLPSPTVSPEDDLTNTGGTTTISDGKTRVDSLTNEIQGGILVKDMTHAMKASQQRKHLHEEFLFQWVVSSGATRDFAFGNSWFFFELLIKTMGHYLQTSNRWQLDRRHRFSYHFCEDITTLLRSIIRELLDRQHQNQRNGIDGKTHLTQLNNSLAFFLNDCLSLMDRTFIFSLIKIYCKEFDLEIAHGQLAETTFYISMKLDFIRILCSHEHFIALNLPLIPSIPPSPSPSMGSVHSFSSTNPNGNVLNSNSITLQQTDLTFEYRQEHYLLGILLQDLKNVLTKNSPWLQSRAINILRNILSSHDFDQRLTINDEKYNRNRVARLYLPLVNIISSHLNNLFDPGNASFGQLNRPSIAPTDETLNSNSDDLTTDQDGSLKRRSTLSCFSEETSRDLLICFLWLLKNIDPSVLRHWWIHMTREQLQYLIQLLDLSIASFEYKGKKQIKRSHRLGVGGHASVLAAISTCASTKKTSIISVKNQLEKSIIGSENARTEMLTRTKQKNPIPSAQEPNKSSAQLRWRKDQTHWRQTNIERTDEEIASDAHLESILAGETTMIVLDTIETIIQIVQTTDCHQILLPGLLKILLHAFALNQSTWTLQNLFSHQRSIVYKFPELLFEEDTEHCADLCLRLLKHCSSCLSSIRSHASASLYLLMRQNFEIGNNFSRVKMQATMSLSWLIGQSTSQFNEIFLRKSLRTILTYADGDTDLQESAFPSQVKDLATNLYMILCDTVKLREAKDNPDMEIDLLHRIANCYQNSPDLRLTWLQNMAQKHLAMNHYAEAGMCLAHAASLVAEYLRMLESKPYMPDGCVTLQKISMNLLEESAVSDDVVSPGDEGICTGKYFTENGFIGLMEQSAVFLTHALMYEAVNEIYHVLTPIYEANRDFKKLSQVHSKLHEYFNRILIQGNKRLFGTYFRVGFYGTKFDEVDGQEFIYKEPGITKLAEIASRLESFYIDKFGKSQVEMIKDSNDVNRASLDLANKVYIQVTYVEPYFDTSEIQHRPTHFDRNYNLKRFLYASPFTKDTNRAHGSLPEQYKRKTILTVERAFPYVKTRIPIIDRERLVLSPIEVAIEDLQKKTDELRSSIQQEPADPKILQMVIQGCISTAVNQGPLEVANIFLNPIMNGLELPNIHHNRLRLCFKEFTRRLAEALKRNKTLIQPDQREYQKDLETKFTKFTESLQPLLTACKQSTIVDSTLNNNSKNVKKVRSSRSFNNGSTPTNGNVRLTNSLADEESSN